MVIKAYLFTSMARQISHTYYSLHGTTIGPSKFFYNLNEYRVENFRLNESFIYEVEIYPETIFICSDKYLQARKYKIIRCVNLIEYIEEVDLQDDIAKELNAIFNCADPNSLKNDFYDLFNRAPGQLEPYEKLKFLAILNRVQGAFPIVTLKEYWQSSYIKFFEFYHIPCTSSVANISLQEARIEKIFGCNKFEFVNNQTEELIEMAKDGSNLIHYLIVGRKLTQGQFEELCDLITKPGILFSRFITSAIISGYKIPSIHEEWFYPYIGYHHPEKIESYIKNKINNIKKIDNLIALENNYMIDSVIYWNSHYQKIIKAKKIFLKDGFKIIERN